MGRKEVAGGYNKHGGNGGEEAGSRVSGHHVCVVGYIVQAHELYT
jgi:hypothetical protein